MAGCSLAGFLFPFTDQSATRLECILIHPFFSYCRNPSRLSLSLSLFRARFIISFQNSSSFEEEASFRCDWMEEIISSKISFILSNLKKRFVIPDRFLPIFPNCTTFRDTSRSELCTVKSEPRVLFHILNVSYYNSMKENYSRLIFRIRRRKFEV